MIRLSGKVVVKTPRILATSADDIVIKPSPKPAASNVRSKWDHGGKTQLVSALEKADIQPGTLGMPAGESKVVESGENKDVAKERREPVIILFHAAFAR